MDSEEGATKHTALGTPAPQQEKGKQEPLKTLSPGRLDSSSLSNRREPQWSEAWRPAKESSLECMWQFRFRGELMCSPHNP